MNYIEFEIGGKLRGFKFGLGFLGDVLEHLELDIQGFGQMMVKNPFKSTPAILFFAHKQECRRKSIPVTFNLFDFEDWLEEMESGVSNPNIIEVVKLVVESATKHLPKGEDEGEKKN